MIGLPRRSREPVGEIVDEPEGFPWLPREHSLLTAGQHAEMLAVRTRIVAAFDELGAVA